MRIRRVRLLNLNSLRGEHEVDLSAEPFASAGIFAITGPTGAGKSTLLDAITLALYGRAARYGSEPNPEDMMSRHTGECRAEVEFEVAGEIFRAAWHLHRARGATDGKVQPPKRYVYDAAGEVLTQKIKEADAKVEALCGLDYGRFMRSVLLAQGEFAQFLKADPNERAALLESLTGTAIYSDLSMLAHGEHSRRERELSERERALGLLQPMSEEERDRKEKEAKAAAETLAKARNLQKSRASSLADADALLAALAEETKLVVREKALATRREEAKATLAALAEHRAAAPFLPALDKADATAQQLKAHESQTKAAADAARKASLAYLQALSAAQSTGKRHVEITETALDRARADITAADKLRETAAGWLKEHKADAGLKDTLPELLEAIAALTNARRSQAETNAAITKLHEERKATAAKQKSADAALSKASSAVKIAKETKATKAAELEKAADGRSAAERRTELEALRSLRAKRVEIDKERKANADHERTLAADREKLPAAKESDTTATRVLDATEKQIEALARHLSDSRLLASFEEQRAELADGAPCPLCGAHDHPYCTGEAKPTAPAQIERDLAKARADRDRAAKARDANRRALTELQTRLAEGKKASAKDQQRIAALERDAETLLGNILLDDKAVEPLDLESKRQAQLAGIEKIEKQLEAANIAAANAQSELRQRETEARAAAESANALQKRITDETEAADAREKQVAAHSEALSTLLKPLALKSPLAGTETQLRETLRERAAEFSAKEKQLADADTALKSAQAEEKAASKELGILRKRVASIRTLLGDQDASDSGELKFKSLDEAAEAVRERELAAKTSATTAEERQRSAKTSRAEHTRVLKALADELSPSPFADIDALRAARLEPEAATRAEQLDRELSDEGQQLKGALASCRSTISTHRAKAPPEGEALAALRADSVEAENSIESLTTLHAELKATLRADDRLRSKQDEAAKSLAEAREQLKVWAQLAALIGSHDGKNFRVFAQGLSLDLLLRHANRHLARLSERYQLARGTGEELGLEIIDLFQASIVRPMSSLSGGESFLASLALALGLSDLAGRNVQIDSLFVDEGFGTLDTETLDTALSALESLRAQDKTVGIISHVEMLKERIGVQIAVEREPDGSSSLRVTGG